MISEETKTSKQANINLTCSCGTNQGARVSRRRSTSTWNQRGCGHSPPASAHPPMCEETFPFPAQTPHLEDCLPSSSSNPTYQAHCTNPGLHFHFQHLSKQMQKVHNLPLRSHARRDCREHRKALGIPWCHSPLSHIP